MTGNIPKIIKTSYDAHSTIDAMKIASLYDRYVSLYPDPEKLPDLNVEELLLETKILAKQRDTYPSLLAFYQGKLEKVNPVSFAYLTEAQKLQQKRQLLFTFFLLYAQFQLDLVEEQYHKLADLQKNINTCDKLIRQLNNAPAMGKEQDPANHLQDQIDRANQCFIILGLTIAAQWFVARINDITNSTKEKAQEINNDRTGTLVGWMNDINKKRLYWVWGGGMLSSILAIWPDDYFNKIQAQQGVAAPSPVTGYMSWVLYYTRFGISLSLLLKHTLGPWVNNKMLAVQISLLKRTIAAHALQEPGVEINIENPELNQPRAEWKAQSARLEWQLKRLQNKKEKSENNIPMWQRFLTQWDQRKFSLLNDSIWATVNMICFFWLKGSGMLGYAGSFVTVGLLFMDLVIATWEFWEESTKHNKYLLTLERDSAHLQEQIAALKVQIEEARKAEEDENAQQQLSQLQAQLIELEKQADNLDKMKAQKMTDWKYARYNLINSWVYALGLMLAFCLVCCFFLPPATLAPATALIIGLCGAAACFVLTVANAAIKDGIPILKTIKTSHTAQLECFKLYQKFTELKEETATLKDNIEKLKIDNDDQENEDIKRRLFQLEVQLEHNENTKKLLYLDIKQLLAESEHQQRLIHFQTIKLIRGIFIDAMIPVVIFTSLMFMPLGIGLGVLAAGLALAFISHLIINRFEPKAAHLPELPEEYEKELNENTVLQKIEAKVMKENSKSGGFFSNVRKGNNEESVNQPLFDGQNSYE